MDRTPSPPPAPQVPAEAGPSTAAFVYTDPARFMEMARNFTGPAAPTNATAAAQHGGILPPLASEPVQQLVPLLGTAASATAPGPSASGFITLSLALSSDNPGPCILNMAPDPLSLEASDSAETDDADEVEMEDAEEVEAIREGRFYLLSPPPPGRNADAGEPTLLILFPLEPPFSDGN